MAGPGWRGCPMLKATRWCAATLLLLLLAGYGTLVAAQRSPAGLAASLVRHVDAMMTGRTVGQVPSGLIGGPFTLVDNTGHTVTDVNYRGHWLLVYFGYTFCPDVCPTELQTMAAAVDIVGSHSQDVVPIFITVDPQRDNSAALSQYVGLFSPKLIGLTGTDEQISAVTREYRVNYARVSSPGGTGYLVDHSSFVYLIAPSGRFRRLFPPGTSVADMATGVIEEIAA